MRFFKWILYKTAQINLQIEPHTLQHLSHWDPGLMRLSEDIVSRIYIRLTTVENQSFLDQAVPLHAAHDFYVEAFFVDHFQL